MIELISDLTVIASRAAAGANCVHSSRAFQVEFVTCLLPQNEHCDARAAKREKATTPGTLTQLFAVVLGQEAEAESSTET